MGEKIPNFVAFRGKDWQLLAAKYFRQGLRTIHYTVNVHHGALLLVPK